MRFLLQVPKLWPGVVGRRCCHTQIAASASPSTQSSEQLAAKLKLANDAIAKALHQYKPNEMMLCFNGGKDCTVLLDVLAKLKWDPPLRAICVKSFDPFEEVEQFIDSCTQRYQLQLQRYDGALKIAVEQAMSDQPQVRAMFLGCRRSDPGCANFQEMMPCDNDWPSLMRIFPLLEWSYHDIWAYLRGNQLSYCKLYDQGYTSLGEKCSTRVNPSLLTYDESQKKLIYRPAYELQDGKLERTNREDGGHEHGRQQQASDKQCY
ncbi:FAD synthase [Scaptodrosophila lebanonensis]|uniref:FAD synthase n=1 Tax=Drosophila lebanonensis TaxID=7225 RepID=A0A6J2TSH5_DROLE|nr:FAD synthase [Scaptodrosophila lebanonensis]